MIEGLFGTILFGRLMGRIATFEEVTRKYTGRFGQHNVHLQKPLLEWAGSDLLQVEMKISLNAAWCGDPNLLLAEWHFYHENAIAAPLVVGNKPMGPGLSLFVVTDLSETHKNWLRGQLIAVELSASFKEYQAFADTTGILSSLGLPGFGALGGALTGQTGLLSALPFGG
jgi:hypothetical protein